MENVEVMLSVMNINDENEFKKVVKNNNITGPIVAVNQIKIGEEFNITKGEKRIYTYKEKGASKSRNRLLEIANGDICIFADDDTKYVENYQEIIINEYRKNPKADIIIFYAESKNQNREKNKKIGNKKINSLDVMKVRTYEITIKKEALKKIKKLDIKFDYNFGPGAVFSKGEETVFTSDMLKSGIKIYSVNTKICTANNETSTWFTGFNEKFLYDQGAIFYRICPKWHKALILQYIVRKYNLYKKNLNIIQAYKQMKNGAQKCRAIYEK